MTTISFTPKRICPGTIDDVLEDGSSRTIPIGEATFYETIFLHTIKAELPRTKQTLPLPVYEGDMIMPVEDDFLQQVDEHLSKQKMYLAQAEHYKRRFVFFSAQRIIGLLYKEKTDKQ